jgi:protein LTV1
MIGVAKREKKKGSSSASTATTSTTSNIPTSIASSSSSSSVPSEVDEEAEPSLEDFASSRGGDDVDSDAETVSSDGTVRAEPRAPPVRPRGESAEDKKVRKLAVKAERSARRVEKKTRQETFGLERKTQLKGHERAVGSGRASDLTALASGGTGTVNVVRL